MKRYITPLAILLLTIACCGCGDSRSRRYETRIPEPRDTSPPTRRGTFKLPDNENVLGILIDLSPSFISRIEMDDGAFDWMLKVIESYGRSHPGDEGRLVIAQISGNNSKSPLVWEGRPSHLRKAFADAEEFRSFLISQADTTGGTRLYESLATSLDYLSRHPTVREGQAFADVIVISDMVDTADSDGSEESRVAQQLGIFAENLGSVGMYYVDPGVTAHWEALMRQNGYENCYFTSMIDRYPELPNFD